jgi:hypothetical protein
MKMKLFCLVCGFQFLLGVIHGQDLNNKYNQYEIETGFFTTQKMEIHGYKQGNATENWKASAPTVRFEYWKRNDSRWNFGFSLQPVYFSYKDVIKNDLNYKGKVYHKGESAEMVYQFHNATATANYPVLKRNKNTYLRLGSTFIFRYADISFRTSLNSFHDKNFIVFPLINYELSIPFSEKFSFFSRADFLPSFTKNQDVFKDGLFNVLFTVRTKLTESHSLDLGTRLFFGGYDNGQMDDYANKTFFLGFVARYSF